MTREEIANAISEEIAITKTNRPGWPKDYIHAAAIVAEEAGELLQAALQYTYEKGSFENMRKEAIQIAAMAIRFMEGLK